MVVLEYNLSHVLVLSYFVEMHLHLPCFPLALAWLAISFAELIFFGFGCIVAFFAVVLVGRLVLSSFVVSVCWQVYFCPFCQSWEEPEKA
ncbi:hypothetical protein DFS34DRAFT_20200 [Phlyctochytrium arcticum]|nr:hypothetical protein DFS34DRAFT_20200 [Phlyctochytrium arcticum]